MGDVFKITTSYLIMYVKLHIIQVREEHVIQIDQTQYMFSKLKKYGYENCILVPFASNFCEPSPIVLKL
jgi:hypothetical protein